MPDVARLGIKVESDQVVQADRRLDRLSASGLKAKRSTDQLSVGARSTSKSFGFLNAALLKSPIALAGIAAGTAAVSTKLIAAASDAEETADKFDVVFAGIEDVSEVALDLADNYGLARQESQELLSSTADLLQGFGVSKEESLALSQSVQELAVDLASFTNYSGGATGASQALTKALLGERESVKSLGIAITDTELKQFAEDQGLVYNELSKAEKAFLTFELATVQSKNAIGDFERSENKLANQTRIAKGTLSDISVELGNNLLPAATSVVNIFNDLTSEIADNIRQTRELREALDLVSGRETGGDLEDEELLDRLNIGYEEVTKRVETLRDKITEFEQSNISQLQSQVPRLRELLAEEEARQEELRTRISLLSEEVQMRQMVADAQREEEEATKKLNEELDTQQKLVEERYKAVRTDVVDILESEKSELQKLEEQYDVLAAHPWSSGQLEEERQQAMAILLSQISELRRAEYDWAAEAERAWNDADAAFFKKWDAEQLALMESNAQLAAHIAIIEAMDRAYEDLQWGLLTAGAQSFVTTMEDVGAGLAGAEDGVRSVEEALSRMGQAFLSMLPQMLLQAGLQLIISSGGAAWPLGLALIASSGLLSIGSGFVGGSANAHGNVYGAGGLQAFAQGGAFTNSIVNQPTLFPFANGTGLMGEAGPEAIMPLTRTPGGDLGVKATGAGAMVKITIINNTGEKVETSERQGTNGEREVQVMIGTIIKGDMARGEFDGIMRQRYGIDQKGVRAT